jgi:hypothetical protein
MGIPNIVNGTGLSSRAGFLIADYTDGWDYADGWDYTDFITC